MPIMKEIHAGTEGVALIDDQLSIASMVHQARISPHAGAVAIIGFRDNLNNLGTPINIALQTKDGDIVARNVFIWNIGIAEVVRNVKDEVVLRPQRGHEGFLGLRMAPEEQTFRTMGARSGPDGKKACAQGQGQTRDRAKQV